MHIRSLALLAALSIAVPACLANEDDLTESDVGQMRERPEPPRPVIDCSQTENEKCWECGYDRDDKEYCCRDECDIVNLPPQPAPETRRSFSASGSPGFHSR